MRILILLCLLITSIQARQVKLYWNVPSELPDVGYYVYRWDTDPYTDPDIGNKLMWPYWRYVWFNHSVRVNVPDDEVSWFAVLRHDWDTGYEWTQVVKSTPSRIISLVATLETNPHTGIFSLKITINGDAGTNVILESSSDLINWIFEKDIIIGNPNDPSVYINYSNFDMSYMYFTLERGRFFRAYKKTNNDTPELLIEFPSLVNQMAVATLAPSEPEVIPSVVSTPSTTPTTPYQRPDNRKEIRKKYKLYMDHKNKRKRRK